MEIATDIAVIIVTILLIAKGAGWLVDSSVRIARKFNISELVIGLTVIAIGTSAPEFATALVAAYKGHHGMSVGNLIGSDIFNMFGVLGLAAIIRELPVDAETNSYIAIPRLFQYFYFSG